MENKTRFKKEELDELTLLEKEVREYNERLAVLRLVMDGWVKSLDDAKRDNVFFKVESGLSKEKK